MLTPAIAYVCLNIADMDGMGSVGFASHIALMLETF